MSPASMTAENEKNSQIILESGMTNESDVAAVILVCAQRDREVVPIAPFLAGFTIKTKALTCNFPRHLYTFLLVDCSGFALTPQNS